MVYKIYVTYMLCYIFYLMFFRMWLIEHKDIAIEVANGNRSTVPGMIAAVGLVVALAFSMIILLYFVLTWNFQHFSTYCIMPGKRGAEKLFKIWF